VQGAESISTSQRLAASGEGCPQSRASGTVVRHGEVEPGWLDRTIDLLWTLMAPPP
jgi:hypothetical protein